MSTSHSSSEFHSPSEPFLPPKETASDSTNSTADFGNTDPAELTPDLENDIDLSTLRFLTGTLRHTFLPYLGWIIAITSFAKLSRFASPYLFRGTRWTADWVFFAFEKSIQFLSWASMWVGMLAAVVWSLAGIGLGVAWLLIKAKPIWRKRSRERPVLTKFVARATFELVGWRISRRWFGLWIGKTVVMFVIGFEGYHLFRSAQSQARTVSTLTPSRDTPRTESKAQEHEETEGDVQAEQWARKVREEMLRESLLRRSTAKPKVEDPMGREDRQDE